MDFRGMLKTPSPAMCVALLALTVPAIALGACGDETNKKDARNSSKAKSKPSNPGADTAEGLGQAGTGGGASSNSSAGTPNADPPKPAPASGQCERQVLDGKYVSYVCPEGVAPPADDGTQLPDPAPAPAPAP